MAPATLSPAPTIADARAEFAGGRGYLAACTTGLPPRASRDALRADLDAAYSGQPDLARYELAVTETRRHAATLLGVGADRIALGSQTSVLAALIAAAVPDGAEVLCVEGDFSSIVMPFVHAGRGIRVRSVPLARLADEVRGDTALVAFSLVQSATGEIADAAAITAAARRHGARTLCDATQALGWLPVDGGAFDAVICHTYKWLCAPRGVAVLAVSAGFQPHIPARQAGWCAGEDPWTSCYGSQVSLAADASRFDVSPAWQAFIGAAPALALFAGVDPAALHAHTRTLADAFRARLELPATGSAIVTWADPTGCDLARLNAAGITASGRAGRARVAFHVFNDADDVELAARALGR